MKSLQIFILVAVALVVTLTGFLYPWHYDEGVFLTIASRMVTGESLYIDYFDHKPPGIHSVLAGGIFLFGSGEGWPRVVVMIIQFFIAGILGQIFYHQTKHLRWSLGVGSVYLILTQVYQGQFVLTEVFVNFFSVAGLYLLMTRKDGWFVYGLLIGIATMFKPTAISAFIAAVIYVYKFYKSRRIVYVLGGGMALPVMGVVGILIPLGNLKAFVESVVMFNLQDYSPAPVGVTSMQSLKMFLPAVGVWYVTTTAIFNYWKQRNGWEVLLVLQILCLIPVLFFRPYHHYWLQILPYVVLLGGFQLSRWIQVGSYPWIVRGLYVNVLFLGLWVLGYGWMIAWPEKLEQQERILNSQSCNFEEPIGYYVWNCKPDERVFFEVPGF